MSGVDGHSPHDPAGIVGAGQGAIRRLLSILTRRTDPVSAGQRTTSEDQGPMAGSARGLGVVTRSAGPRRPVVPQLRRTPDGGPDDLDEGVSLSAPAAEVGQARPVSRPRLAPTTHTYEMSQLAVLHDRLTQTAETGSMTAADLGLDDKVPANAVLVAVRWDGPPEYPYVHGRFSTGEETSVVVVDLHTSALREISRRLGLRQVWTE